MYAEKRTVNGKTRYFLAHSFREGGKVHKIRKLLGEDLNSSVLKDRIEKAKELILEEINKYRVIKDPLHTKLTKEEIEFVRKLEIEAELKIFHLSEKQWELFSELFTYNTNAIEGSELNNQEVKDILEEDRWPDKSKSDIAEAYGVNESIKFIRTTKDNISIELIKKLHQIVFKNSKRFAGEFRKQGQEVVVRTNSGHIVHEGAPQSRVVSLLKELVDWYDKYKKEYPALILAAVIHNQFETIHPFADGNGRVGRLLLNNILIKHGLPPVNIDLKNRVEYYESLQAYQKEHNIRPTLKLILKEYKSLKRLVK